MKIHTLKDGESLANVAYEYGVSEDSIRINNELESAEPVVGDELLILIPTRTYTLKRGDTPERLSLRFGVRPSELISMNPGLAESGFVPGRTVALKYDTRKYGMAASNGYFYRGCDETHLKRTMPYLTYVTFAAGASDGEEIKHLFDPSRELELIRSADKIPLLRIYDRKADRNYLDKEKCALFIDNMIDAAAGGGYKGIVLAASGATGEGFAEFLIELRKRMIGCDLILITEIDESTPTELSDYADGNIFSYSKYVLDTPPSFEKGERLIFSDFACDAESAKVFIDLPALAKGADGFCSINEALSTARRAGAQIKRDEETLLCSFEHRRHGKFTYTSLENIKATLELLNEFGFMGISFDIMRTPLSHLLMYNALFKTATQTSVRAREGCSRES